MSKPHILAVPNISEGRDRSTITHIAGTRAVLDVHTDADHNRTVITYGGTIEAVTETLVGMVERAVTSLDLTTHEGVHPRFGVVDVLPLVPYGADEFDVVQAAGQLIWEIAQGPGVPVYPYGIAGPDQRTLPELRRWLRDSDNPAHPSAGVICLGVRDPLIAFNINLDVPLTEAKRIARAVREPGLRALGFPLASRGISQVSMNLTEPARLTPADAFARVAELSSDILEAEVVGLVPEVLMTTLSGLPLMAPARGIETALASTG